VILIILAAINEVNNGDGMVFAICAQLLYLWALLYIARQMAVEVSDGASEQVLLVVVICVEVRLE